MEPRKPSRRVGKAARGGVSAVGVKSYVVVAVYMKATSPFKNAAGASLLSFVLLGVSSSIGKSTRRCVNTSTKNGLHESLTFGALIKL